jgi:HK97 family phage major capsid protein
MSELREIAETIEQQGRSMAEHQAAQSMRLKTLETEVTELAKKAGRPSFATGSGDGHFEQKALAGAFRALLSGDQQKANGLLIEARGMSAGSDPDGGYVVLPFFSSEMTKVMAEISPISRLARTVELDHGLTFEEPIDRDQAAADWVAEMASRGDTTAPQLGLFRVECAEICAQPKATQSLIDGANIDIVAWLSAKVAEAFATTESGAFHTGNGVGKPRGFLSYPTAATADATRAWGTIQYIPTGASGAFAATGPADVLVTTVGALKSQYRTGAVWLMNRSTAAAVMKIKSGDGQYLWSDSFMLGQPPSLLGYPVEISENMPDIGAGSLSIAFGNFQKGYTIVRRLGTRFLVDPYTDKPNMRVYSYARVGGGLNSSEAIKLVSFSAS